MFNYFYYRELFTNPYAMVGTIFVMLAALLGLYAQIKVKSNYAKYKTIKNHRGLTGAEVARQILDSHGMSNVPINKVSGELSDHFNPSNVTINLSDSIYSGTSIAAMAVAAHECGHAIQNKEGYAANKIRSAILPFANIGNYLGWIAIAIGLVFSRPNIAWIGFGLMLGILAFQIVTLPVEFNASSRALVILQAQYLDANEYIGAKRMLSAAALTYVAGVIQTLASMLRVFLIILSHTRNND